MATPFNQIKWLFLLLIISLLSGCNVLQEEDSTPFVVAEALPATAGEVIISGQGSENGDVEILAVPNQNWDFSGWSGDIQSTENPLILEVTENLRVTANFTLSAQGYLVILQLGEGDDAMELILGQVAGATDGFDSNLDLEAPPPPPSGVLFGRFQSGDRTLLHDFRNPLTSLSIWEIGIQFSGDEPVPMSWEVNGSTGSGNLILTNGDESLEVDMLQSSQTQLDPENSDRLVITFSQTD